MSFFTKHLRVGTTPMLLIIDLTLFLPLAADYVRYRALGLSSSLAGRQALLNLGQEGVLWHTILLALAILIGLPVFIASALTVASIKKSDTKVRPILVKRSLFVQYSHIVLACLLVVGYSLCRGMESASGIQHILSNDNTRWEYTYVSWAFSSMYWTVVAVTMSAPVAGAMTTTVGKFFVSQDTIRNALDDYIAVLTLLDIDPDLSAVHTVPRMNFNSGSIAPVIRFIDSRTKHFIAEYNKKVPGSKDAAEYLKQSLASISSRLITLWGLSEPRRDKGASIEFYASTSRALEVALLRMINKVSEVEIVLTGLEHPVESEVAKWIAASRKATVSAMEFEPDVAVQEFHLFESKIISFISERHKVNPTCQRILVISKVCWANGRPLNVDSIIRKARKLDATLKVIVDGAHSVGNGDLCIDRVDWDMFIGSTHKWMYCPEPGGFLVTYNSHNSPIPYDCWNSCLPQTSVSAHWLAGMHAVLQLNDIVGLGSLISRSLVFRDNFLAMAAGAERMEVIGANKSHGNSLLVSVRPRAGHAWVFHDAEALDDAFKKKDICVLVISWPKYSQLWVRVSFGFFQENWQLRALYEAINDLIVRR